MGLKHVKGKEKVEAGEVQTGGINDSAQFASGVITTSALASAAVSTSAIASGAVSTSALASGAVGTSALVTVLKSDTWSTATLTSGSFILNTGLASPTGFVIMPRGAYFVRDLTVSTSQIAGIVCSGSGSAITVTTANLTFWAFE